MHVVELRRHRNRKVVAVAKEIVALAEGGDLHGIAFVLMLGPQDHRAGIVGEYQRHPAEAILAALRLKQRLLSED
jgi:hypothetical protein